MKRAFCLGVIFGIMATTAMAQELARPYSYKFDQGTGDCLFKGVTKDALWAAAVKAALAHHYYDMKLDKPSDTISASNQMSKFLGMPVFSLIFWASFLERDR